MHAQYAGSVCAYSCVCSVLSSCICDVLKMCVHIHTALRIHAHAACLLVCVFTHAVFWIYAHAVCWKCAHAHKHRFMHAQCAESLHVCVCLLMRTQFWIHTCTMCWKCTHAHIQCPEFMHMQCAERTRICTHTWIHAPLQVFIGALLQMLFYFKNYLVMFCLASMNICSYFNGFFFIILLHTREIKKMKVINTMINPSRGNPMDWIVGSLKMTVILQYPKGQKWEKRWMVILRKEALPAGKDLHPWIMAWPTQRHSIIPVKDPVERVTVNKSRWN